MATKIKPTSTTGSRRVIGQPTGFAASSGGVACGLVGDRGPGPASSSTIAATSVAVAARHGGGVARQKSGDGGGIVLLGITNTLGLMGWSSSAGNGGFRTHDRGRC